MTVPIPRSELNFINKYNRSGPRYTSYPTALELSKGIKDSDLFDAVQVSGHEALSLYIHIPFCNQLCYYCACNKMVTRQQHKVERYLLYVYKEMAHRSQYFQNKKISQIHMGGGTPNFLRPEKLEELIKAIYIYFDVAENAEISIELDPRLVHQGDLQKIREIGFNRLSMGIQDFDRSVQLAINRVQEFQHIQQIMGEARKVDFDSINLDLIYGLPHQSLETTMYTLHCVEALQPDRISLFNYAHMPSRFAAQRKIKDEWLPSPALKQEMLKFAKARLLAMGYQHIGMDHFAKPEDSLSIAQKEGRLHRNFQGYTELEDADLLGFGITSISQVGNVIVQNHKTLHDYYEAIDKLSTQQPASIVERGIVLDKDDMIRAAVIKQLICHCSLDINSIEKEFEIVFLDYFAEELNLLAPMVEDGLVSINDQGINIVEQGKQFVRTVCMSFDKYLPKYRRSASFSKVI